MAWSYGEGFILRCWKGFLSAIAYREMAPLLQTNASNPPRSARLRICGVFCHKESCDIGLVMTCKYERYHPQCYDSDRGFRVQAFRKWGFVHKIWSDPRIWFFFLYSQPIFSWSCRGYWPVWLIFTARFPTGSRGEVINGRPATCVVTRGGFWVAKNRGAQLRLWTKQPSCRNVFRGQVVPNPECTKQRQGGTACCRSAPSFNALAQTL